MEENNIDIFDSYLRNELSITEKQQFEHKLNKDPEFNAAFQEHEEFIKDIQQNTRLESLQMIRRVQDDFLLKKNIQKTKVFDFKRLISIAAIFIVLIGFGFGIFYFSKNTENQNNEIADNQSKDDDQIIFGGSVDRNLILKKLIPVLNFDTSSLVKTVLRKNIMLEIYRNTKYNGFYKLQNDTLIIFSTKIKPSKIITVILNNEDNKLYLNFGVIENWYLCEANSRSKELSILTEIELINKLNHVLKK